MSNEYEHLDLALLPGEHVIYKSRRGIAKLNLASWLITTNKRLIVAKKRFFASTYNSIFYSSISMVSMKKGITGSKVVLALNDGKSKLSSIRFVKKLQALSLFSILSNQVSTRTDMQLYTNVIQNIQQHKNTEGYSSIVERVEAGNAMFAEMLKCVELNSEKRKAPVLLSIMRKGDNDTDSMHNEVNKLEKNPKVEESPQFNGFKTFHHVVEVPSHGVFLKGSNVFAYGTSINSTNLERSANHIAAKVSWVKHEEPGIVVPFVKSAKLDPDHDMLIFRKRKVAEKLGTKDESKTYM
jgi:hypothetical protein